MIAGWQLVKVVDTGWGEDSDGYYVFDGTLTVDADPE